ncbi:hypothetical protein [Neobacillus drentensis]|uniref:hypothetical protein n=1 Tax=Neobacillus drentensis TaxID=220684 RepID=UPI0008265DA2|nr:hypothetical protein [Neobacillus drentensis]
MKNYLLLVFNIALLVIFSVDRYTEWNSVLAILGYFCPIVSIFYLGYMMGKDWKGDISKVISIIGQAVVGITSVGHIAFIFLIL